YNSFFRKKTKIQKRNSRMILVTLLLIGSLFHQAHCVSSVKPANEATSITVQKGDDALFQWNIVLENGDQDVGLKLLNGTTELWTQQTGKVSDAGKELLQERLKVEKSVTNLKATIRNVDFNDSSIELKLTGAISDSGFNKLSDVDSSIALNVQVETPSPPPSGDDPESGGSNAGAIAGGVIGAIIVLVIIVGVVYYCKAHKTSTSHRSRSNYGANGGEFEYTKNERQDVPQYERPENVVPPSTQTDGGAQQQPQRQKYDELGPGGRVGPRDHVVHSKYAEVKQEEDYGESDQHEDEEGNLVSDSVIV
uniref:Cnidarian restricted protein n=1 Tax=Clytia hemisphaerica TaxID=252671 RepID=A0A7M5XIA6_9CNID